MTSQQVDKEAEEILKGCPVSLEYYVRVWLEQRISARLQQYTEDTKRLDWLEKQGWPLPDWLPRRNNCPDRRTTATR